MTSFEKLNMPQLFSLEIIIFPKYEGNYISRTPKRSNYSFNQFEKDSIKLKGTKQSKDENLDKNQTNIKKFLLYFFFNFLNDICLHINMEL